MSLLSGTPLADSTEYGLVTYPKTAVVNNNIIKAEIDGKRLLKNVYKHRKELAAYSFDYTESELRRPEWIEIGRELLDIEGDLLPDIKVQVPIDWKAATNSAKKGMVDLVINGETFALDVGPIKNLKESNDEIIIHVKGYQWNNFHTDSKMDNEMKEKHPFFLFWDSSLVLGNQTKYTKGHAILVMIALGALIVYVHVYNRYILEMEREKTFNIGTRVCFIKNPDHLIETNNDNCISPESSIIRDSRLSDGDAFNLGPKRKGKFLARLLKR